MTKRTSLSDALSTAADVHTTTSRRLTDSVASPLPIESRNTTVVPPSREGKKAIVGYFDPSVSRQVKEIALAEGKTVQGLLREALNDLFAKRGKSTIA